jgi:hypothetical protein
VELGGFGPGLDLGVGDVAVPLLAAGERGRLIPAVVEVVGEAVEESSVGGLTKVDQRWRLLGEADVSEGEEDLVVSSVEDVGRTGGRCAELDRVDVEQGVEAVVWLLNEDADSAAVRGACTQERDELGLGCEIGDEDLDPFDRCAEELGGFRCDRIRRVRVARDHVSRACVVGSTATGVAGAGTASGQSACSVVSRTPATRVRCRGYGGAAGEPATHGLDVDLDDVGELVERQPRAGDRGPQLLVLQPVSPSRKSPISSASSVDVRRPPRASQDVLGDVPRCPCAVPDEAAW